MNFMRDGQLRAVEPSHINDLRVEFEYYKIPLPPVLVDQNRSGPIIKAAPVQQQQQFEGGDLLSMEYKNKLMEWLPNKKFKLIYKATRDGFGAKNFHSKCDIRGTLVVVQSVEGYLFGGYTSQSWEGNKIYKNDPAAFLFTLSNPHSIPCTQYPITPAGAPNATYCAPNWCAAFGGDGTDFFISFNSHQHNESSSYFPFCYNDTTGKGNNTFTGSPNFTTKEVEVYSVNLQ